MDTYMNYPRMLMNRLVGEALNPTGGSSEGSEGSDASENAYGLPGASASEPGSDRPQGASMGSRFNAMAQQARPMMNAMAPTAAAASYGLDSIQPGTSTMANAAANWAKPGGTRGDFTDAPPPGNMQEYLHRLAHIESKGNFNAHNKSTSASGAFQYTDPTWGNYQGYKSAGDAPPEVQTQRAQEDLVNRLKSNNGDLVKSTLTHFLGAGGLRKMLANPQKLYEPVNSANGDTTPFSYGAGVLGSKVMQDWAMKQHQSAGQQAGDAKQLYNLPASNQA